MDRIEPGPNRTGILQLPLHMAHHTLGNGSIPQWTVAQSSSVSLSARLTRWIESELHTVTSWSPSCM